MKISMLGLSELKQATEQMNETKKLVENTDLISERLDKNMKDAFSVFSDIDFGMRDVKAQTVKDIAKMRTPEVLNTRIVWKLDESNLNQYEWERADAIERNKMMDKMFDIMMEEMQIPQQVRSQLALVHVGTQNVSDNIIVSGHCNCFVGLKSNGGFEMGERPFVEMHCDLMYGDYETALCSLYNQAVKVMQQSTCLEPAGTYSDVQEQAKWAAEVRGQLNGEAAEFSHMQRFASDAEKDLLKRYQSFSKARRLTNRDFPFK